MSSPRTVTVDIHLTPDDLEETLRGDVTEGLSARPYHLPPKWFYDAAGSELFDKITRLAEYYPTEAERTVLQQDRRGAVVPGRAQQQPGGTVHTPEVGALLRHHPPVAVATHVHKDRHATPGPDHAIKRHRPGCS